MTVSACLHVSFRKETRGSNAGIALEDHYYANGKPESQQTRKDRNKDGKKLRALIFGKNVVENHSKQYV